MKHTLILLCVAVMCLGFCACQQLGSVLGSVPVQRTIGELGGKPAVVETPFEESEDKAFAKATEEFPFAR